MKPLYVVTAIAPCDCTGDPRNVYVVHVDGKTSKSDAVAITGDGSAALDIADEYNNGERVAINARNREVAANARTLMAAAPELLAACVAALPLLEEYRQRAFTGRIRGDLLSGDYEPTQALRAAIAKARGES